MSIVGDFTIPTETFSLEHALSTVPEITVEADRLATHSPQEVLPFLWATGGDNDAFHQALEVDPTVTSVSIAGQTDDEVLYRLEWRQDFHELIHDVVDHHATITEATAQDDHWRLQLRFADEEMVSKFQSHFQKTDYRFTVHQLCQPSEPRQRTHNLTAAQYEALVAAVRGGYFQIPRKTSVEELGEELHISANAVSQRIRRGTDVLVRDALLIADEEKKIQS